MKNYFQELYEQLHAPIYRYIFYLLQHQMIAKDLTQETFTKCYEKNMHFINHTEALYWLRIESCIAHASAKDGGTKS